MPTLTRLTRARLEEIFPPSEREAAATILEGMTGDHEELVERCRLAALKVSGGRIRDLLEAADLYRVDFRDLLVNADFAVDTEAHLRWDPKRDR